MARPYIKPSSEGPQKQYYCGYCEVWDRTGAFTNGTYYDVEGEGYVEIGGVNYYESYTSWEIWLHATCGEAVSPLDGRPDHRTLTEVWVCGECGSEYEDRDSAYECC